MILSMKQFVILGIFVVILGGTVVGGLDGIFSIKSEEEAIEISKNSPTVQEQLQNADRYTVEVHYLNVTRIAELKEGRLELGLSPGYEFLPTDHGAWHVVWYIHPKGAASAVAVVIGHYIDEETGEILHEGQLIAL